MDPAQRHGDLSVDAPVLIEILVILVSDLVELPVVTSEVRGYVSELVVLCALLFGLLLLEASACPSV